MLPNNIQCPFHHYRYFSALGGYFPKGGETYAFTPVCSRIDHRRALRPGPGLIRRHQEVVTNKRNHSFFKGGLSQHVHRRKHRQAKMTR